VQNYVEERAVDLQTTVVVNKAQFPEPVQEEADSRAGCACHFCQHLLADLWNHGLECAFLARMGELQEIRASLFSLGLKSDPQVRSIGVWRATFPLPGEPLGCRAGDMGCPPTAKKKAVISIPPSSTA